MSGIELTPGSKVFTARCKNLYVLTTKHKIMARNKIQRIKIENPFDKIVTIIDNNDYSYKELDIEEDLEIVKERLSTSKRTNYDTPSSSRSSTSRRLDYEFTNKDILLGMPFLEKFYPHTITKTHWYQS